MEDYWASLEDMFFSKSPEGDEGHIIEKGPNIIYSTGDSLISALSVPYPRITVKPLHLKHVEGARVVEAIDNWLLTELDIPAQVEDMITHCYLYSRAMIKIGYDSEFGYDPDLDFSEGLGATLSMFNKGGNRIEYKGTRPGMPWVQSVLPHDIIVPWGTRYLKDAPWIAHRVVRHIDDVKGDRKYLGLRDLEPTVSMQDFLNSYETVQKPYRVGETVAMATGEGKEASFVEIWEIRDKRTGKIYAIATGHDKFLRHADAPLQIEGLPFTSLGFVPVTKAFWTTPSAYYLRFHQAELADISIQASKQRRLAVVKLLYQEGAIDDDQLENILSDEVGLGVKVNAGFDLQKAVAMFGAHNNLSLYQDAESVRRNAREIMGFSRNQAGEFEASGRRTATEAMTVERSAMRRVGRKFIALRRMYIEMFRKINQIIFKYWTGDRVIPIVGEDGAQQWVSYTAQDII